MTGTAEILTAIRELSNLKGLDRTELHELLQDGIHAALAKKHGTTVQAEVEIDENRGNIRIVLLKTVVAEVTDPARETTLEEAQFEDPEFQLGDVMEIPVDFAEFGRSAVQAAKQRIIQRVREGERTKIRDEFSGRVGDLLSGEIQQIERGKRDHAPTSSAKRRRSCPTASRTIAITTIRAIRSARSSSVSKKRPRGRASS
jgi:N utilization substance protein A